MLSDYLLSAHEIIEVALVERRDIRRTAILTPTEERDIDEHLINLNRDRRRQRLRKMSFSMFAVEAVLEKIEREKRGELARTMAA